MTHIVIRGFEPVLKYFLAFQEWELSVTNPSVSYCIRQWIYSLKMLSTDKSEQLDLQCVCKGEIHPWAMSHTKKLKII